MRRFYAVLAVVAVVSVNVWLGLLWLSSTSQEDRLAGFRSATASRLLEMSTALSRIRDMPTQPLAYEYEVIAVRDGIVGEIELRERGRHGWSIASCRRALDALKEGVYECIVQRPTGVLVDRNQAVAEERELKAAVEAELRKSGLSP